MKMFKSHYLFALIAFTSLMISNASVAVAETDLARGAVVFKKCIACHELERPRNKMGPHLNGLLGRKAGSIEGYKYSQAMKEAGAAGLVWDDAKLKEFIATPKSTVPGTSMRFFGLWSESDITD